MVEEYVRFEFDSLNHSFKNYCPNCGHFHRVMSAKADISIAMRIAAS